jgi:hypothetical protein
MGRSRLTRTSKRIVTRPRLPPRLDYQDHTESLDFYVTLRVMPTDHILALLIAERDKIDRAIQALGAPVKRRGRPPGSGVKYAETVAEPVAKKAAKKRTFSPAQREAARKRMKAFWAKKKKAAKKTA